MGNARSKCRQRNDKSRGNKKSGLDHFRGETRKQKFAVRQHALKFLLASNLFCCFELLLHLMNTASGIWCDSGVLDGLMGNALELDDLPQFPAVSSACCTF